MFEIVRFGVVGGLSVLTYVAVLNPLAMALPGRLWLVSAVAYAASMVANYLLQRSFTFRSDRPHRKAVGRYLVVHGVGITLNAAMLQVLVAWIHFSLLIVQGAAVVTVGGGTYRFESRQ